MRSAHYIKETKVKVAERKKGGVYSYRLASLLSLVRGKEPTIIYISLKVYEESFGCSALCHVQGLGLLSNDMCEGSGSLIFDSSISTTLVTKGPMSVFVFSITLPLGLISSRKLSMRRVTRVAEILE